MSTGRWIAVLAATALAEITVAAVLFRIQLEENCGNGIPRWQCSQSLEDTLVIALLGLPSVFVLLLVIAALRGWVQRRSGGTPN